MSFIGFGLPAFLLMVALSDFYVRSHALPPVVSVFNGLQTIIVAIVANATVSFGKTSLQGFKDVMIAAVAAGMFATGISPIMVIILAALLGLLIYEGNSVERRGHWLGFTAARRARVEMLFQQWGVLTVLLSRSLLSFLSSAVNLLAGASRYWLRVFLVFAIVGRLIWTLAYLGLGYGFGVGIEAAAEFPSSVSGLLASLAAVAGLGFMIYRDHARISAAQCQPNAGPG